MLNNPGMLEESARAGTKKTGRTGCWRWMAAAYAVC